MFDPRADSGQLELPNPSRLTVVIPALNESARIAGCLASLIKQDTPITIMVSDNASDDETLGIVRTFSETLELHVRTVTRITPSEHFISSGLWALSSTNDEFFAFLAGDDSWQEGFARAAMFALENRTSADVAFPTFVWETDDRKRTLLPISFQQRGSVRRRLRALLAPDGRELANLVYGVYRREAFAWLLSEWGRGGDEFGSDYAAAWSVIGRYRVVEAPAAVSQRSRRPGADLLARVGLRRQDSVGPIETIWLYLRLNVRVNLGIGRAVREMRPGRWRPGVIQVFVLRAPQWIWNGVKRGDRIRRQ